MPQRYVGHKLPPVLFAFPAETIIAGGLILSGLLVLFYPGTGFYNPPVPWFNIPFALLLVTAGTLTIIGVSHYKKPWQAGVEQLGLWLTASSTAAYALIIGITGPRTAVFTVITFTACSMISVLRAMAVRFDQVRKLEETRAINTGALEVVAAAQELREEVAKHDRGTGR